MGGAYGRDISVGHKIKSNPYLCIKLGCFMLDFQACCGVSISPRGDRYDQGLLQPDKVVNAIIAIDTNTEVQYCL